MKRSAWVLAFSLLIGLLPSGQAEAATVSCTTAPTYGSYSQPAAANLANQDGHYATFAKIGAPSATKDCVQYAFDQGNGVAAPLWFSPQAINVTSNRATINMASGFAAHTLLCGDKDRNNNCTGRMASLGLDYVNSYLLNSQLQKVANSDGIITNLPGGVDGFGQIDAGYSKAKQRAVTINTRKFGGSGKFAMCVSYYITQNGRRVSGQGDWCAIVNVNFNGYYLNADLSVPNDSNLNPTADSTVFEVRRKSNDPSSPDYNISDPTVTYKLRAAITNTGSDSSQAAYLQVPNPDGATVTSPGYETPPQPPNLAGTENAPGGWGYDGNSSGAGCGHTWRPFCKPGTNGWYWSFAALASHASSRPTFSFKIQGLTDADEVCFRAYASPKDKDNTTSGDPTDPSDRICLRLAGVTSVNVNRVPDLVATGDVHAGGLIPLSGVGDQCGGGNLALGSNLYNVEGPTTSPTGAGSYSSSAVSATGSISNFGSAGAANNGSQRLGNQSGSGGYTFSICNPSLRGKYAGKVPIGDDGNKLPRCTGGMDPETPCYAMIGTVSIQDKNACDPTDGGTIEALISSRAHKDMVIVCRVITHKVNNTGVPCSSNNYPGGRWEGWKYNTVVLPRINSNNALNNLIVAGHKTLYVLTEQAARTINKNAGCAMDIDPSNNHMTKVNVNITYGTAPDDCLSGNCNRPANLPSFALISDGNIRINGAVSQLDGFFIAGDRPCRWRDTVPVACNQKPLKQQIRGCSPTRGCPLAKGLFITCNVVPKNSRRNTEACNHQLKINGMAAGRYLSLTRTGNGTTPSSGGGDNDYQTSELIGGGAMALLYVGAAPPGFIDTASSSGSGTYAEQELPPLF